MLKELKKGQRRSIPLSETKKKGEKIVLTKYSAVTVGLHTEGSPETYALS